MNRRARWFATFVTVCIAAVLGFFAGSEYSRVKLMQERVASTTVEKVQFLYAYGSRLSEDARLAVAASLPSLVASLDAELSNPTALLVDYERIKDARDKGLVYLKVFPPKRTAAHAGPELKEALAKLGFYRNPDAEAWRRNEDVAAAEDRIAERLEAFNTDSLDPANRALYEALLKQKQ